jgi:hypothetical protein
MVVRLAGVEPATLGLEVRCSIQLSYRRVRHLRYTNGLMCDSLCDSCGGLNWQGRIKAGNSGTEMFGREVGIAHHHRQ